MEKFIDEAGSDGVRMAVRNDSDTYLRNAFGVDKFKDVDVRLVEHTISIDDIATFAREQIAGTPWREAYLAADVDNQEGFGRHMAEALSTYANEVPFASWLLTASIKSSGH